MKKIFRMIAIVIEAAVIIALVFVLVAAVNVIRGYAATSYIDGKTGEWVYAEDGIRDNAIDILDQTISNISNALDALDASVVDNPYLTINMTDAEAEELRWVLALEAQGEGLEGEIACCEAIFNRVLSGHWGTGVHGVLSMKGQFSTYKRIGSSKAWATPGQLEDDAISECMRRGPNTLPSMKYVYFDSKGGVNGRNKIKIGHHWFGAEK